MPNVGQVGTNVPVPVSFPVFSWGGNRPGALGGVPLYVMGDIDFYNQKGVEVSWLRLRADISVFRLPLFLGKEKTLSRATPPLRRSSTVNFCRQKCTIGLLLSRGYVRVF